MPGEPTYKNNLGLSLFERKHYDDAIVAYNEAIALETAKINLEPGRSRENLSFYHKNLGLALYHMEDLDEALKQYNLAIDENPNSADNYFNLGNVKLNQGRFDEAHEAFENAIQREDRNAKFYHAKGLAYQAEAEAIARSKHHSLDLEEEKIENAIRFFQYAL